MENNISQMALLRIVLVTLLQSFHVSSAIAKTKLELAYSLPDSFVSEIYMKQLYNWRLVFIHDNHKDHLNEIERVLLQLTDISVEFRSGSYILPIQLSIDNPNPFKGSTDSHRLLMSNSFRSLVILLMHEVKQGTPKFLFNNLTPLWDPVTIKDEDYYVFLGPSAVSEKLMMSPEFGLKLKYKISLHIQHSGTINVNSVAPYTASGKPELISLLDKDGEFDSWTTNKIFPDLTLNQFGRRVKMAVPKADWRLAMDCNRGDKRCHPVGGSYKFWIVEAMKKWNFSYDLFQSSMGGGTGMFKNGTWLGAVGDVLHEEAEMAFWIAKILSRYHFVDWSAPLSYEWIIFECHEPKLFFSPKAIIWPFSSYVWTGTFFSILFVVCAMKFLIRIESGKEESLKWKWRKLMEYTYSVLLEQDAGSSNPSLVLQFSSLRTVCTFWLIFALIMSNTYRAKLVSLIAFPVSSWVPDTFEELSNSQFRVGLNVIGKGGAAYDLFRSSSSPTFKTILEKLEIHPDALKCLKEAENSEMCCCMWAGTADYINQKNISDKYGRSPLKQSSSYTFFVHDGIIFQKKALFRKQFDVTIWNAVQMGLVKRWQEMDLIEVRKSRVQWEKETNQTGRTFHNSRGPEKLKVFHFFGAFVVLSCGITGSFLILLYEVVSEKRKRGKK